MRGAVLLITRDAALAQRVRRALPAVGGHEVELTAVSAWAEIADTGATEPLWLLAMLDVLACKHGDALAGSRARHAFRSLPLLWLGESPRLAAGLPQPDQLPGPIIDFLDRTLPDSKLAFILQQHLRPSYLRLRYGPLAAQPRPDQVQAALNNDLTGILGNAELAAELARNPNRRLPSPLAQRLECIVELASHMRSLVDAAEWNSRPQLSAPGS